MEAPEAPEANKAGKSKASAETPAAEAKKPGKVKQASAETAAAETLASFAVDCDNVLAFLQAVTVKSPKLSRRHSPFAQTSERASGSNDGQTCTCQSRPRRPHKTTWASRTSSQTSQPGCTQPKLSVLSSPLSAIWTRKLRCGTASHRLTHASSSRQVPPPDLNTNLAASHHPPLPQREEYDGSPGLLFLNLRRERYLIAHLLLPGPPPRAHTGHSRS